MAARTGQVVGDRGRRFTGGSAWGCAWSAAAAGPGQALSDRGENLVIFL